MLLPLLGCAPDPVELTGVSAEVDPTVATLILVRWTQDVDATTWVEFLDADGEWRSSPPVQRGAGAQEEWILGVPADTDVEYRVVADREGVGSVSADASARTGSLPPELGEELEGPEVAAWDEAGASEERWLLGSVDVDGGSSYSGPFWLFIVDRQGRVVWYRDLDYATAMFPRVARDGTHIAYDFREFLDFEGEETVVRRQSLDGTRVADVSTPGLGWAWDETTDGDLLYDRHDGDLATLESVTDGTRTTLWECTAWLAPLDPDPEHCFTNTVNWTESKDTVLWSTYWGDWVAELDRATGEVLWYAGAIDGGWTFDPEEASFDLQHYPNYTPDGTLLVSTHISGQDGQQRSREFRLDEGSQTLVQEWSYGEGVESWARYSGEAVRLPNGNTIMNYGTGGDVREIDAAGETVWHLRFGDERTLGHTQLVEDLYAINAGP